MAKAEPGTELVQYTPEQQALIEAGATPEEIAEMGALAAQGKESLTIKDIRLPGLVLVQPTSGFDAKAGSFVNNVTMEEFQGAEVVLIKVTKSRVRFGRELGQAPLCQSSNALDGYGDPGDELERRGPNGGGDCNTCPQAIPRKGDCKLQFHYLGAVVTPLDGEPRQIGAELPVGLTMKSTSIRTATKLNSILMDMEFPWSHTIEIDSVKTTNDKGTFFVWEVKKGRPVTPVEGLGAIRLAKRLATAQRVTVVDADKADDSTTAATDDDIPF